MKLLSPGEASIITGAFLAFAAATIASSVSRLPTLNAPIANFSFLDFSNHSLAFINLFHEPVSTRPVLVKAIRLPILHGRQDQNVHHLNAILRITFSRRLTSARK